jgi:hypothetical protein
LYDALMFGCQNGTLELSSAAVSRCVTERRAAVEPHRYGVYAIAA